MVVMGDFASGNTKDPAGCIKYVARVRCAREQLQQQQVIHMITDKCGS
jgi:hypothetical protein